MRIKFGGPPRDPGWARTPSGTRAEAALRVAIDSTGLEYSHNPGEGAFYGPKLEFVLRDAIGRDWQCGTVQVDFNLPGRLGASYVGEDGERHVPVMIHRAMLGSIERFAGILIEHYAGHLPLWLAPRHAVVCTIHFRRRRIRGRGRRGVARAGLHAEADTRNETISYKVREHSHAKAPVILALGKREVERREVLDAPARPPGAAGRRPRRGGRDARREVRCAARPAERSPPLQGGGPVSGGGVRR